MPLLSRLEQWMLQRVWDNAYLGCCRHLIVIMCMWHTRRYVAHSSTIAFTGVYFVISVPTMLIMRSGQGLLAQRSEFLLHTHVLPLSSTVIYE